MASRAHHFEAPRAPLARRGVLSSIALAPLLLAGCGNDEPGAAGPTPDSSTDGTATDGTATGGATTGGSQASTGDLLAAHGLHGMDAREIIEHLEALTLDERPQDLMASVRPSQLLMSDAEGRELALPIEGDFYLSTAPFVEGTHECWFHSLTTCRGELAEVDVEVRVADASTGEVIHQGAERTHPNGFFGLWLPRGGSYEMICSVDGATSSTAISTATEDDATCLTTMQLT